MTPSRHTSAHLSVVLAISTLATLSACSAPMSTGEEGCRVASECAGPTLQEAQRMNLESYAACLGPRPAGENINRQCVMGIQPPPPCNSADDNFCPDGFCMDTNCGWGECIEDCSADDSCAAQGLTCVDGTCEFSCHTEGYEGCPGGGSCRPNGQCGAELCADAADCERNEVCNDVTNRLLATHDGCDPRPCMDTAECSEGLSCAEGYCSLEPGICGEAMIWSAPP